MKLSEKDLLELAQIYNTSGKSTLIKILKEKYQIKNTYNTIKRLEKRNLIDLENGTDKKTVTTDDIFMSMDELCAPIVKRHQRTDEISAESKSVAMERMVHELIGDRLLELSRYITLNTSDKLIVIDKTTLSADGYQLIMH